MTLLLLCQASNETEMMNFLTAEDVTKIGGLIMSGFKLPEINTIKNQTVKKEVFRAIGRVPLAELMPVLHPDRLKDLTLAAVENRTSLAFEDLDLLGSLAFFLPASNWDLASSASIKRFIEESLLLPHHKCICLPKANAEALKAAMIKAYGSVYPISIFRRLSTFTRFFRDFKSIKEPYAFCVRRKKPSVTFHVALDFCTRRV